MKLSELTTPDLIMLDVEFSSRIEAIEALTDKLTESGKLSDRQQFLDAVMKREEEGPTALGEYLAVPHGKSEAVRAPVFACALLKSELPWQGLDGDEPVNMIFLLAIPPAQAGSTHMALLTTLTSSLVDDDFRERLLESKNAQQVMDLFSGGQDSEESCGSVESDSNEADPAAPNEEVQAADLSDKAYPVFVLGGLALVVLMFFML
ncbi:fructose PTS transporter subunit IIA [Psychromonas ossibalaenae]|uniref:fructose PTS transporter subunit IIA n=1 Tax=Psychromonas ossibalaenae TaxID=444922 RepID=UPI00037DB5DC|nr:fructose PTS transporter subunit IIA [Psychromonas ossibalaenae]